MRTTPQRQQPARLFRRGFTVLELMLSVAIMTVITIALYTVFDQTQKALRNTMSQVDVLEGVRATTDLIVRDLEVAVPVTFAATNLTSFAARVPPSSMLSDAKPGTGGIELQALRTGANPIMTTTLQELFFVTHQNDRWAAIGYWLGPVATNQVDQPVVAGRLYRFSYETNAAAFAFTNAYARFNSPARLASSHPVVDGVVHLRVRAYSTTGLPLVVTATNRPPVGSSWFVDPSRPDETAYWFSRETAPPYPAALELEIGILESEVVRRYASIPVYNEGRKFIARNAGRIQLFRYRIPLRNAPPF